MEASEVDDAGSAKQWMKDVNEQLDGVMDDVDSLRKKVQQNFMLSAVLGGVVGLEGVGIATLFKMQKSIVETLQQVVNAIPTQPMTPEQVYRAEQAMAQARREQAQPPMEPMKVVTEEPGDVAPPVQTAATEAPEWAKHAMAEDPDWASLIDGPTE